MVKTIKFFCSLQKKDNKKQGRWSQEEQDRFLKGCYFFKNDWEKIKDYIKTRTIPQIRSHAQKYLIKICRKYSIKLSKKKFSNRLSKHLDITKIPYKGKTNISNMSIYEKNILEMFNYYNREILREEEPLIDSNNNENQVTNIKPFNNYDNSLNYNLNLNTLNNTANLEIKNNLIEKENNKDMMLDINEQILNLNKNNNLLNSNNQIKPFPIGFPPNIINNNNLSTNNNILELSKNQNQNIPLLLKNDNNFNIQGNNQFKDFQTDFPINYMNNFNQNKYFIQNEYEFYLMQKISYYNTLLLNTIKSNQKINENILLLLGYNSKINQTDENLKDKNKVC